MLKYVFNGDKQNYKIIKLFHDRVNFMMEELEDYYPPEKYIREQRNEFHELLHSKDIPGELYSGYMIVYVDILDEEDRIIANAVAIVDREN